ncbi:hypothetical protein M8J77_024877 [Diaphorina citri]|nr:hypothetical protein M8J77_024877 [Diaphorina citri]
MFRYLGVNQVRNIDSLYSGENIEINRNLNNEKKEEPTTSTEGAIKSDEIKDGKTRESGSSEKSRSHSSEKRPSHSDRFDHKRDDHHTSSHHHRHHKPSHQSSSSSRQQSHQRYQRQLQLDKFNRFRRSVSVEPSAYRSQQKSFIQKSGTVANYGSRYSNQRKQRRREGGAWGETRHPVPGRGKRGGYQGRRGNRRRQNMRNMMNRDHEDDDAMDLEMPPPPNQHFRHNIHNKKGFKSSFNPRPPLLPLPLPPCPPPSMMMLPPPAPPVYDMPPPPPPPPLSHQDNTSSSSSSSEALQKEKYEHNRMLAEKRDEHLMKEKALYEDLHLLQSQRAKLLKQHDPHNNKIVKENEKLQDEIRKKMEATKSAIQMLTDIIGDHMQYTIPQVSRRVSAGSPEHKSDSSESSEDDDESHSSSDTASEAPPSPPNMPPPSPDRPKRKPYLISRNRNIFVRRRDITTRDRRKIDTTAYIQTAGQAVLKSQQQETLEEKSQKMEQKLHHCDDTDSEDIFPLASSVENKSTKRTMEEDIEDIFNLRRPATQRPHVEDMETEGDEKEREEEENNTSTQMPRRKSPTTIIEEIILDGNEDLGGILTKLDQENMPRRTNIQITLKQRDKRNKCEEKREKSGKKMEDVPAKGLDINETEKDNVGNKQQSVVSHESQRLSDKLEVFWCSSCNLEFDTDVEYLRHLHCASHMNNTKAEEPWLNSSSDPVSPSPATPQQKHQICAGSQWLIPVVAWYCKLCHDCFADIRQAAKHLQCPQHWTKLENHMEENPLWEITLLKARTQATLNKIHSGDTTNNMKTDNTEDVNNMDDVTTERVKTSDETLTSDEKLGDKLNLEEKSSDDQSTSNDGKINKSNANDETKSNQDKSNDRERIEEDTQVKPRRTTRHEVFEDENTRDATSIGNAKKLWVPNRREFDRLAKQHDPSTTEKKKPSFIGKMPMGGKGKIRINVSKPEPEGNGIDSNLVESVGNILNQLNNIYRNEQDKETRERQLSEQGGENYELLEADRNDELSEAMREHAILEAEREMALWQAPWSDRENAPNSGHNSRCDRVDGRSSGHTSRRTSSSASEQSRRSLSSNSDSNASSGSKHSDSSRSVSPARLSLGYGSREYINYEFDFDSSQSEVDPREKKIKRAVSEESHGVFESDVSQIESDLDEIGSGVDERGSGVDERGSGVDETSRGVVAYEDQIERIAALNRKQLAGDAMTQEEMYELGQYYSSKAGTMDRVSAYVNTHHEPDTERLDLNRTDRPSELHPNISHTSSQSSHLDIDFISRSHSSLDRTIPDTASEYFHANQHRNHMNTFLEQVGGEDSLAPAYTSRLSDEEDQGETRLSARVENIMKQRVRQGLSESSSNAEGGEVAYMSASESEASDRAVRRGHEALVVDNDIVEPSALETKPETIGFQGPIFFNKHQTERTVLPFLNEDPHSSEHMSDYSRQSDHSREPLPAGDIFQDCEQLESKLAVVKSRLHSNGKQYATFQDAFRDHREQCAIQMRQSVRGSEDVFAQGPRREEASHRSQRATETPVGAMFTRNRSKPSVSDEESRANEEKQRKVNRYLEEEEAKIRRSMEMEQGMWNMEEDQIVDVAEERTLDMEEDEIMDPADEEQEMLNDQPRTLEERKSRLVDDDDDEEEDWETEEDRRSNLELEEEWQGNEESKRIKKEEKRPTKRQEQEERLKQRFVETGEPLLNEKLRLNQDSNRERIVKQDRRAGIQRMNRAGEYEVEPVFRQPPCVTRQSPNSEESDMEVLEPQAKPFLPIPAGQPKSGPINPAVQAKSGSINLAVQTKSVPMNAPVPTVETKPRRRLGNHTLFTNRYRFEVKVSDTDCSPEIDDTIDSLYEKKRYLPVSRGGRGYPSRSEFVNYALRQNEHTEPPLENITPALKPVVSTVKSDGLLSRVHPATHFQTIEHAEMKARHGEMKARHGEMKGQDDASELDNLGSLYSGYEDYISPLELSQRSDMSPEQEPSSNQTHRPMESSDLGSVGTKLKKRKKKKIPIKSDKRIRTEMNTLKPPSQTGHPSDIRSAREIVHPRNIGPSREIGQSSVDRGRMRSQLTSSGNRVQVRCESVRSELSERQGGDEITSYIQGDRDTPVSSCADMDRVRSLESRLSGLVEPRASSRGSRVESVDASRTFSRQFRTSTPSSVISSISQEPPAYPNHQASSVNQSESRRRPQPSVFDPPDEMLTENDQMLTGTFRSRLDQRRQHNQIKAQTQNLSSENLSQNCQSDGCTGLSRLNQHESDVDQSESESTLGARRQARQKTVPRSRQQSPGTLPSALPSQQTAALTHNKPSQGVTKPAGQRQTRVPADQYREEKQRIERASIPDAETISHSSLIAPSPSGNKRLKPGRLEKSSRDSTGSQPATPLRREVSGSQLSLSRAESVSSIPGSIQYDSDVQRSTFQSYLHDTQHRDSTRQRGEITTRPPSLIKVPSQSSLMSEGEDTPHREFSKPLQPGVRDRSVSRSRDQTQSTRDRSASRSRASSSQGQASLSQGQIRSSQGHPSSSQGQISSSQGLTRLDQGQTSLSQDQTSSSQGQSLVSEAETRFRVPVRRSRDVSNTRQTSGGSREGSRSRVSAGVKSKSHASETIVASFDDTPLEDDGHTTDISVQESVVRNKSKTTVETSSRASSVTRDTRVMTDGRNSQRELSLDRSSVDERLSTSRDGRTMEDTSAEPRRNARPRRDVRDMSVDRMNTQQQATRDKSIDRNSQPKRSGEVREMSIDRSTDQIDEKLNSSRDRIMSSEDNARPGRNVREMLVDRNSQRIESRRERSVQRTLKPGYKPEASPRHETHFTSLRTRSDLISPGRETPDRTPSRQSESSRLSSQTRTVPNLNAEKPEVPGNKSDMSPYDSGEVSAKQGKRKGEIPSTNQPKRVANQTYQDTNTTGVGDKTGQSNTEIGNKSTNQIAKSPNVCRESRETTKPHRSEQDRKQPGSRVEDEKKRLYARMQELQREIQRAKEEAQKRELQLSITKSGKPEEHGIDATKHKEENNMGSVANVSRVDDDGNSVNQGELHGNPVKTEIKQEVAYPPDPSQVKLEPDGLHETNTQPGYKNNQEAGSQPGKVKSEDELSSGSRDNYDSNVHISQYVSSQVVKQEPQASSSSIVGQPATPPLFIPGIFIKSNEQFVVKSSTIYKKRAMSKKKRIKEKKKKMQQGALEAGQGN